MDFWLYGRGCQLGCGLEGPMNLIVPLGFTLTPYKVENTKDNKSFVRLLSDRLLHTWSGLNPFLSDAYLKWLDNQIVFDDRDYYLVDVGIVTRSEECRDFVPPLTANISNYVYRIDYGTDISFVILKEGLPETAGKTGQLLDAVLNEKSELNESQKKMKCRALVNFDQDYTVSLGEMLQFISSIKKRHHQQLECPIKAWPRSVKGVQGPVKKEPKFKDKNEAVFKRFLAYLYVCMRKLEIKLESEQPFAASGDDASVLSAEQICSNLDKAKKDFKELEKPDFLCLCESMRTLFVAYRRYLKCAIDNRCPVQCLEDVPGSIEEIKRCLQELNDASVLKSPAGFARIEKKLRSTKKLRDLICLADDSLDEPCLVNAPRTRGLIGFVNMTGSSKRDADGVSNSDIVFQHVCPRRCTDDSRMWICTDCGCVVKLNVQKQLTLVCDCGSKLYSEDILTCANPAHEETLLVEQLPETLRLIVSQLRKHQNRYNEETNETIKSAISVIIREHRTADMSSLLQKLKQLNVFDGDTNRLMDKYLALSMTHF